MLSLGRLVGHWPASSITSVLRNTAGIDGKFNAAQGANGERISRLVILDSADIFVAIIHRSVWVELLNIGLRQAPPANIDSAQLGPLIDLTIGSGAAGAPAQAGQASQTRTYRDIIRKAVAFINVDQMLADAKAAMDAVTGCQDVIVTQTGAPTMPIIGWIMNTDIGRLSQA